VLSSEQAREHEPGRAGSPPDRAVRDHFVAYTHERIECSLQFGFGPKRPALVVQISEGVMEGRGNVTSPHVKMWLGSYDLGFEYERIAAVRDALGSESSIIIDAAQAYDWRTAARLAKKVEDLGILWFEDPVEYEDLDGLAALGAESPVPLGTGEHVYGIDHLKQHLDLGVLRYAVLDMERIGGVTDFLAAAALCGAHRVELVNHCFPHASMQVLATAATGSWCELAPLWDGYFGQLEIRNGMVQLDRDAVGIGHQIIP
jgi:L-alanine-DL-glutamate epimerase-like enolase superfamily enzyme